MDPFDRLVARRNFVRLGFGGLTAATLGAWSTLTRNACGESTGGGRAKCCIVLFCWGGRSHVDTFDMKPDAGIEVRGEFAPIATSVSGIFISEHMPEIARRMHHLAVVRSVHHEASDHRAAAYWNLTGRPQRRSGLVLPSREDWPCLGSMVAFARRQEKDTSRSLPGTVSLPYPQADRGLLNGQFAGMLGIDYEPVYVKPKSGRPYQGTSPEGVSLALDPLPDIDVARAAHRVELLNSLDASFESRFASPTEERLSAHDAYRLQALDMIGGGAARAAFDLSQEPEEVRAAYGDHICGQSVLTARRLTEAGVPLVTVYCNAGDLAGGGGSHWDTHGDNFKRLKRDLLPPLDQASGALLDDLQRTGRLDETLVVWFTEFGRTPKINGSGRDHFPNCYSVAFAGGGIRGGQIYGRSDAIGSAPAENACGPGELHATIFHALGIDVRLTFNDLQGRPRALCESQPLPLF